MFDYIIVGAGSAGCVLANRLTEDGKTTVLLLEAGGPDKKQEIHIPAAFPKLMKGPCDWEYYTEEQADLNNRKLYWPRGKVLGGSSSINAMIYTRGSRLDYDHWLELGNEGWGFSDVLPYFKKSENQERGPSDYHGAGGPLNVADLRYTNPLTHAFVNACLEAGLFRNDDFNGAEMEGAGFFQVTHKQGKRHSAADAYLKPALNRPNLSARTHAHLTRVLFENTRAVAVEYRQDGKTERVKANREVILCGGAINSPQMLMISGIGPADDLKAQGISVMLGLPGVGQNLQDHILSALTYECSQPVSLAGAETIGSLLKYLLFRKGPFASNIGEAGGFIKSDAGLAAPDVELIFGPSYYMSHGFSNPEGHGFSVGSILLQPQSRGYIALRSSDPLDPPAIQPNYLSSEADLHVLLESAKIVRRIAHSKAFDEFRGKEVWPGDRAESDEDITEFLRNTLETFYHPVGTCKMGDDAMAVVDSRLRVRGAEGLRVVDASVMPTIIRGHPNAPTIMIAEKAADMLKADA